MSRWQTRECVRGNKAHVEVLTPEKESQKGQKLKFEIQGILGLR